MAGPIEDYALIGNCETAALVARDGSIDWLCWPRFDSGACFAALLGTPEHGRWQIAPADPAAKVTRRYREDTLILETEFSTSEGAVTVVDFMPWRDGGKPSQVVRLVMGQRGKVAMSCEFVLRFGYGSAIPWVTRLDDGAMRAIAGPDMTILRTPVELRGDNFKSVARFVVSEGETVPFILSYGRSYHDDPPDPSDPMAALKDTEKFWRDWAAGCRETGKWSAAVRRSLITLKALAYHPTGGIVAAPTTSLPEQLGGARNWDYRYCWLRDATFTLLSLMNAGYYQSAREWREWLVRAVAGSPQQLQIMYGIEGERLLTEVELPWLPGYQGAKPVRIGNAASNQLQLDIYGELMDALYQGHRGGLGQLTASFDLQRAVLGHLGEIWREPDDGIWEVRGGRQHFTYSKVMAWVAFDRAVKLTEEFNFSGPADQWRATRQEIHDDICRNAFNEKVGAFTQYYRASTLDASVLLMPLVGFLPATDPRVASTVAAIERGLMVEGLIMRYDTQSGKDGLAPGEGAFLACSFWYVDNLVLQGRLAEAEQMFERLCGLRNDVGLLSEEYDPRAKRLVGNFPQAFSHIGLVRSAHNLTLAENALTQRAAHQPGTAPAEAASAPQARATAQPSN
ncbi:MAG: glycoside hydrolase family 15 protein [Pseudorhodoplanes sp.]|uniref:glycoside hydrolase family 15 protein n=1 Tax=Pseudorhodoplanes sp. TaxID=1934341 RepID=UPI003D11CAB2